MSNEHILHGGFLYKKKVESWKKMWIQWIENKIRNGLIGDSVTNLNDSDQSYVSLEIELIFPHFLLCLLIYHHVK